MELIESKTPEFSYSIHDLVIKTQKFSEVSRPIFKWFLSILCSASPWRNYCIPQNGNKGFLSHSNIITACFIAQKSAGQKLDLHPK